MKVGTGCFEFVCYWSRRAFEQYVPHRLLTLTTLVADSSRVPVDIIEIFVESSFPKLKPRQCGLFVAVCGKACLDAERDVRVNVAVELALIVAGVVELPAGEEVSGEKRLEGGQVIGLKGDVDSGLECCLFGQGVDSLVLVNPNVGRDPGYGEL